MPGFVEFANWRVGWMIPSLDGGGLTIKGARFDGKLVLASLRQPFSLASYHGVDPAYKDGLSPKCTGVPYTALTPIAPNAHRQDIPPQHIAGNDDLYDEANLSGAVMVEKIEADLSGPAQIVIWAKFQAWNYQFIHRYEFHADGAIHAAVGLGGELLPVAKGRNHIHNFYFRLDLDVVTAGNNLVQRFAHKGNALTDDVWIDITQEKKEVAAQREFTKWRVLNKVGKANGKYRSYELIPGSEGAPDGTHSTGDLWVLRYDASEDGAAVGCTDAALETEYATGQAVDGVDVVVWYCLRHHHAARELGEESKVLPYHFLSFHLAPRDFLDATPKSLYPTDPVSPS